MTTLNEVRIDDEPDEENKHDQLPSVEEIRASLTPPRSSSGTRFCRIGRIGEIALIATISSLLVIIIALSVSYSDNGNREPATVDPSRATSPPAPTAPREPRVDEVTDFFVNNNVTKSDDILTIGTPQQLAVHWLSYQDELNVAIPESLEGPDGMRFVSRYVAALLYYALNGSNWSLQLNFTSQMEVCDWNELDVANLELKGRFFRIGIACNNGFVSTLQLPGLGLEGTIPSEIKYLSTLRVITLNGNKIGGTIPEGFQAMEKLDYLALQSNKFEGTLPLWFGSFSDLRVAGLGNNNLDGTLPMTLGSLTKLITLGLDNNRFTGGISSLRNMTGLKHIFLDNNVFESELDGVFATMNSLEELDLSSNRFRGTIPEYLFRYSTLRILDLQDNSLDGSMPKVIPFNPAMSYFSVYQNLITGELPSSIYFLDNLTHLDLSSNRFEGTIPEQIQRLSNLKYLYLSDNAELTPGPIPEWIGTNLTHLEDLSLRDTRRMGNIPTTLGLLKNLTLLDLHNNNLTGPIPRQLGETGKLRFLLLSKNELTGQIPVDFELMTSLDLLFLNNNSLTGNADGICSKGPFLSEFWADCDETNPEISCKCCSKCCLDTDDDCNQVEELANLDPTWKNSFEREFYEYGSEMIFENR